MKKDQTTEIHTQKGWNDAYPEKVEVWCLGIYPVPDWIVSNCKISSLTGDGDPVPEFRRNDNGGYELISSANQSIVFVRTNKMDDFICYGDNKVFSLTRKQFDLLYE